MTRAPFIIPAKDGAVIHGVIDTGAAPSSKLVILSHGLTGHIAEDHHVAAAKRFMEEGFDVVRFFYYSPDKPGARRMIDTTLQHHARDLNDVADRFDQYERRFIAGHSYGGLTMLFAAVPAHAYSFWDSAFVPTWYHAASYSAEAGGYKWQGEEHVMGKAMYDEAAAMTVEEAAALTRQVQVPSQVILAEGPMKESRRQLFTHLECEKECVEIPGADHVFSGAFARPLLDNTVRWFKRFS